MFSERSVEVLLGPPGTGKTAELTRRAKADIESGVSKERIGFVSFSRAAVGEALERMEGTRDQFPWFRTIHALGYALSGIKQDEMVSEERLMEFSRSIGEPISASFATGMSEEARLLNEVRGSPADVALGLYARANARDTTLEHEFKREENLNVSWELVKVIIDKYETYKRGGKLWDFSDLVTRSTGVIDADIVYVDEAQDTTRAQWNLLRRAIPGGASVVLAGDDDQCIYRWSGADPVPLTTLRATRTVLGESFRVPLSAHGIATRVSRRIPGRIDKVFAPRKGDAGLVESVTDLEYVDLRKGEWLLLARTRHSASQWRAHAHLQGVVYQLEGGGWSNTFAEVKAVRSFWRLQQGRMIERAEVDGLYRFAPTGARAATSFAEIRQLPDLVTWEDVFASSLDRSRDWWQVLEMDPRDAGYIRELRRNGESLYLPGRVRISTVHRAKGLEADNVGVLMSIPRRVAMVQDKLGDELRVMYVALTRARHRMVLAYVPSHYQWSLT